MAKSMYKEHREEILELKKNDKTNAEIVVHLNNKYKIDATLNSLRVFFTRDANEQKQKKETKIVPPKQETPESKVEKITPETIFSKVEIKKDIENEVKARLLINELNFLKEKYQEAIDVVAIIHKELGDATEKLRDRAEQKDSNFFLTGIWFLTILFALFTGYYIGRCFSRNAFLYAMHLLGIPGGILIGLATSLVYKKTIRGRKNEE